MTSITHYAQMHTAVLDREAAKRAQEEAAKKAKYEAGRPIVEAFAQAAIKSLGETFGENLTLKPVKGPFGNIGSYLPEDHCRCFAINVTRTFPRTVLKFLPDIERVITAGYLTAIARKTVLDGFALYASPGNHPDYEITRYQRRDDETLDAPQAFNQHVGKALASGKMAAFVQNLKM